MGVLVICVLVYIYIYIYIVCAVFLYCIFILICFVCSSEGLLSPSDNSFEVVNNNNNNNNNVFKDPATGPPTKSMCINKIHL